MNSFGAYKDRKSPLYDNVNGEDIEQLFNIILNRSTGSEEYKRAVVASERTVAELISELRNCEELSEQIYRQVSHEKLRNNSPTRYPFSDPFYYRVPQDLKVSAEGVSNIIIVGSCLAEIWVSAIREFASVEIELYTSGTILPEAPKCGFDLYDFQLVQLPLRSLIPDLSFFKLKQDDPVGHRELYAHSVNTLRANLDRSMRWNKQYGLLTFVTSLITPQQNLVGRFMPRYDFRNPVYFIEKLNEELYNLTREYDNAHFFDINEVMSSFGRKYSQEDNISIFTHGSFVGDFDQNFDRSRLEDAPTARDAYQTRVDELLAASWNELVAMYRTVRQIDAVKMVVIDLDDTLWRGVIADSELGDMPTSEGWPIGFWEALVILKRRGILLGIISKNEESRVREAWDGVLRGLMNLEDFAIFRINWGQKSQNLAEILKQVNILSRNVLYIDDNPAQRADIQASFPEIRVLGGAPYSWRHILLWAAEMQGVNITNESVRRTEMVQAQVKREEERQNVSPEQFLESLNIVIHSTIVRNTTDGKFKRAFELIKIPPENVGLKMSARPPLQKTLSSGFTRSPTASPTTDLWRFLS